MSSSDNSSCNSDSETPCLASVMYDRAACTNGSPCFSISRRKNDRWTARTDVGISKTVSLECHSATIFARMATIRGVLFSSALFTAFMTASICASVAVLP
eukprot:CAMPEP_0172167946 /NCGR_PEP_ID=MMETSP1050-20130122/9856_1 /TAXON_ID=233186 /ORGANISM="Cryptomonas curvata, Strain CCAP979/52" /LENGTH=99 /DNA_ID=CAMNT_0012838797 /DNA_START=1428 /DNA_END=1727 /DNA_ORIENTATION=-